MPKVISTSKGTYVKVVRIANEGFNVSPYGETYHQPGEFLDITISSLDDFILELDHSKVISLKENRMNGCFCFAYIFDHTQAYDNGNLRHRKNQKFNVGYLEVSEIVYVRNVNSNVKMGFVHEITSPLQDYKTFNLINDRFARNTDWVRMPLSLVIERTKEHLQIYTHVWEEISEVYVTEDQFDRMVNIKYLMNLIN